uniref:Uncharacterized protein n=1 Tax=Parascaris equorum TaxID=6256 RepID=A0A914S719_PAREQ
MNTRCRNMDEKRYAHQCDRMLQSMLTPTLQSAVKRSCYISISFSTVIRDTTESVHSPIVFF